MKTEEEKKKKSSFTKNLNLGPVVFRCSHDNLYFPVLRPGYDLIGCTEIFEVLFSVPGTSRVTDYC